MSAYMSSCMLYAARGILAWSRTCCIFSTTILFDTVDLAHRETLGSSKALHVQILYSYIISNSSGKYDTNIVTTQNKCLTS